MAYGIGLAFDPQTEVTIQAVWHRLAELGFVTPLTLPRCPPHVTLISSETVSLNEVTGELEKLVCSYEQVAVEFSSVGIFTQPAAVLFYGITPTACLLRLHAEVEMIYRGYSSASHALYQSGRWVPHCTLAGQVDPSQLAQAMLEVATIPLPFAAHQVSLAIAEFDASGVEIHSLFPFRE